LCEVSRVSLTTEPSHLEKDHLEPEDHAEEHGPRVWGEPADHLEPEPGSPHPVASDIDARGSSLIVNWDHQIEEVHFEALSYSLICA
jgi:hypothetical protein